MDDSVLVALIGESLLAETAARRQAARILLDMLRTSRGVEGLDARVASIGGGREVMAEIDALLRKYDLNRDPA